MLNVLSMIALDPKLSPCSLPQQYFLKDMMRILVIGGTGMLGHKLVQVLGAQFDVATTIRGGSSEIQLLGIYDRHQLIDRVDLNDVESVRRAISAANPDVVINAAGVVKQVPESADAVLMLKVNAIFPQRLAELSFEHGFRLITISTDCVFSGNRGSYSESDLPDARDLYGVSKLLGEVKYDNCLTIRTSIIGRELTDSHGLVEWFLSNRGKTVDGYVNAIYSGFPTVVLADIISNLVREHPKLQGIYHVSSDPISKFELLRLLDQYYDGDVGVKPSDVPVIDRSLDSSAFRKKTAFLPLTWDEMIYKMASDPTPYEK
jgi:dTDP-4-dehydrorhamnose reductase